MATTASDPSLPARALPPPRDPFDALTETGDPADLKLLDRYADHGSTPAIDRIDHELHNYAYQLLHRQAAADAQWACHVLAGAIDQARTAEQALRIEDMHLGRTLAERSMRTYGVLAAMTTHAVYAELTAQWDRIAQTVAALITHCLEERARHLVRERRAARETDEQADREEREFDRERAADTYEIASHLAEAHRLGGLSNRIAHVIIHSPLTSQSVMGI